MNNLLYFLINFANSILETPLLSVLLVVLTAILLTFLAIFKKFFNSKITVKEISTICQNLFAAFSTTTSKNLNSQFPMEQSKAEFPSTSIVSEQETLTLENNPEILQLQSLIKQISEVLKNEKHN